MEPEHDDPKALRFDALIYGIELFHVQGDVNKAAIGDLMTKAAALTELYNIPEVAKQRGLLEKILETDYLEHALLGDWEHVRMHLRGLIKYIPPKGQRYVTDLSEQVLGVTRNEEGVARTGGHLEKYRERVEAYIRRNMSHPVIHKLKTNIPLTTADVVALEKILWKDLGSKEDYEQAVGDMPLGIFIRRTIGMDMNAAKEAFAEYLDEARMDSRQIYFVNQIIEYIVKNGMMTNRAVLREAPFTDRGSITEIFTDQSVLSGILHVIDTINGNTVA